VSEPRSLYARVTLGAAALAAWRAAPVGRATDWDDWMPWLAVQSYSGPRMTPADIAAIARRPDPRLRTNGDWIDAVAGFGARAAYDAATQRWALMVIEYSENYREYIEALAVLRGAARFKDRPGDDFVLIFPYMWGYPGGVGAGIGQGSSTLWGPLPGAAVAEASAALQALYEDARRRFNRDDP
jgi:hypothetical protein